MAAASLAVSSATAQSLATATQLFQLSAFGGATGTFTGLPPYYDPNGTQGRNVGLTLGVNLAFPYLSHYQPSAEIRGSYPFHKGSIDAQENVLFGGKIERHFHRVRPYVDFLYGRGRINYENGGYPSPDSRFIYLYTNSAVLSPGGGVDLDLTDHFAAKLDFQYQHIGTPAVSAGHIYAKPITVGVIYRFDFNHHTRYTKDGMPKPGRQPAPPRSSRAPQLPPPPPPQDTQPSPAPPPPSQP